MTDEIERMRYDSYREWKREMKAARWRAGVENMLFTIGAGLLWGHATALKATYPGIALLLNLFALMLVVFAIESAISAFALGGAGLAQRIQEKYKILADYHLWQLEPEESV